MGRPAIPEATRQRVDATVTQLRELFPDEWTLRVPSRRSEGADIELSVGDQVVAVVEVKTAKRLDPRSIDRLALPDAPVIVYADWLSPRTRDLLRERGASYVDGTGNVDVSLTNPPIVLRSQGAQRDPNPRPTSGPTLRGPRAWALMRTLVEVSAPFTAGDLAQTLGIDNGYVTKVLQVLADDRLIEREPRQPVTDVSWEALLRQITRSYSLFDSNETSTWVASSGPARLLEDLATKDARRWAVSGSFATPVEVSVAPAQAAVIYTDDSERLARIARLLPTNTGANVVLARPFDPIVFERLRTDGAYPRVSIAQTAIDLLTGNARMPEEGEALLDWMERNEQRWQSASLEG